MDCIRQNHTYKLEHTMFVIAIQEQHLIIAVLHLEVAMRPKPFNQVPFPSVTESQSVNLFIVPLLRTWKYNLIVFIFFFCIYFLPRQLPRLPQRKLRPCISIRHYFKTNIYLPQLCFLVCLNSFVVLLLFNIFYLILLFLSFAVEHHCKR